MNRYLLIRRLRWPMLVLLTGVIALLNQADILSWWHAWPLYLILLGVLMLAERAAINSEEMPPPPYAGQYPGAPYPGAPYAPESAPQPPATVTTAESAIVPVHGDEIVPRGGQS